jgi:carbon-monoxide dehydrogenase small subunit
MSFSVSGERPSLPPGPPIVAVEVSHELAAPVDAVWAVLTDLQRLTPCLPGAELTAELGDDRYAGRARVAMGPVRLSFSGLAQIVERDAPRHRMQVVASGSNAGSSSAARIHLSASSAASGTVLHAVADVYLGGLIAQFGKGMAAEVSRRVFADFAAAVEESAITGGTAAPRSANALAVVFDVWRDRLRTRWRPG